MRAGSYGSGCREEPASHVRGCVSTDRSLPLRGWLSRQPPGIAVLPTETGGSDAALGLLWSPPWLEADAHLRVVVGERLLRSLPALGNCGVTAKRDAQFRPLPATVSRARGCQPVVPSVRKQTAGREAESPATPTASPR